AATGFRVFLPMLIVSGAANIGHLQLDNSFAWLGTPSALTMLSVAALAEVLAYYVPVIDNLLDTLATPAALIAGTLVSAAVMTDVPPMVKWTAAVIAGGGIAGLTQGLTGMLRAHSTVLTGGIGNPVIATAELGGALLISFLALVAPAAAIALVILFLLVVIRLFRRLFRGANSSDSRTEVMALASLCVHSTSGSCDGVDECRRAVRRQVSYGADAITFVATDGVLSNIKAGLEQQFTDDEIRIIET